MEEHFSVRAATPSDREELIDLKCRCTQLLYTGYLPESYLQKIDTAYAAQVVDTWLQDTACVIGVLDLGGRLGGYIVCEPDRELQGWGIIQDTGADKDMSVDQKWELTRWAIETMRERGCGRIHIWLLQDNLRGRFTFESFGFKGQREMKQISRADYAMAVRRYTYDPLSD